MGNNNNQNKNFHNNPNRNDFVYNQHNKERIHDQNHYHQRPNHIHEASRRVTTFGADGTSYQVTATSDEHDGEEVYLKTDEEIKEDRLNQLNDEGIDGELEGSKRPNEVRLFITRCAPYTTCRTIENHILNNFSNVMRIYCRKNFMYKNDYYCSFVVKCLTKPDVVMSIEDFQSHNWPDDIRVFKGREPSEERF